MPDISHLATKTNLEELRIITKADFAQLATKAELTSEVAGLRAEMMSMDIRLSEKLRVQGWQLLGGMGALIAAAVAIIKLTP